ncbi:MAG: bifunctional phosphoribosylaminoimidazolecarboxamide formyltransferase/IMP cyclohydrolase [Candidatus Aminicenantes bacterium]|nr:bifunctional phosphoribosylaminoimidazolecarboxamide formyltransferase/IMP cyclohydrolase [Candidatus Aminicenantes bacterium]
MKRALISVYDKEKIGAIAAVLKKAGWEIISTGGTASVLREQDIPVSDVSGITNFPEILDGRVKTLHPLIFGPVLARKTGEHLKQLEAFGAPKIDMVIVNFYPFEEALEKKADDLDAMLENIDIGGPSLIRAAAKNFKDTVVLVDEKDYPTVIAAIESGNEIPLDTRRQLAQKAFARTAFYDSLIAAYLGQGPGPAPDVVTLGGRRVRSLRYGENPHQAAFLAVSDRRSPFYAIDQLHGKELSFNNILDLAMVYELLNDFQGKKHFSAIVKHQNPCGAAMAASQPAAFQAAFAGDPRSAFGGIVGCNQRLEPETAAALAEIFFEVIVAPDFSAEALRILNKKKNLRLVRMPPGYVERSDFKTVPGGFVYQERDIRPCNVDEFELKAGKPLGKKEKADVEFGWKIIKYVKSNGIIVVKNLQLIGVGAGQPSRIDAVELAIGKSQTPVAGSVLLSDAFFPFPDSVELAAKNKIAVVVETGGSVRDPDVILTAQKLGISLLFTGIRHFRH